MDNALTLVIYSRLTVKTCLCDFFVFVDRLHYVQFRIKYSCILLFVFLSLGSQREYSKLFDRSPCETNKLGGQMTIFHCGKVNVYDGVPLDKVMKLPLSVDTWKTMIACWPSNASKYGFAGTGNHAPGSNSS